MFNVDSHYNINVISQFDYIDVYVRQYFARFGASRLNSLVRNFIVPDESDKRLCKISSISVYLFR